MVMSLVLTVLWLVWLCVAVCSTQRVSMVVLCVVMLLWLVRVAVSIMCVIVYCGVCVAGVVNGDDSVYVDTYYGVDAVVCIVDAVVYSDVAGSV